MSSPCGLPYPEERRHKEQEAGSRQQCLMGNYNVRQIISRDGFLLQSTQQTKVLGGKTAESGKTHFLTGFCDGPHRPVGSNHNIMHKDKNGETVRRINRPIWFTKRQKRLQPDNDHPCMLLSTRRRVDAWDPYVQQTVDSNRQAFNKLNWQTKSVNEKTMCTAQWKKQCVQPLPRLQSTITSAPWMP